MQTIEIKGIWKYDTLDDKIKLLKTAEDIAANSTVSFNFLALQNMDSSGIILLIRTIKLLESKQCIIQYENMEKKYENMLQLYLKNYVHKEVQEAKEVGFLEEIGTFVINYVKNIKNFLYFLGHLFAHFLYLLMHPSQIRFKATIVQIEIAAIHILPIVALALFLVGFVTAYQGAEQLGRFGANIIVIEMSTMSMFREIAPFLAAVIVAGRSASSFTAQLGTMKITEEISAMKTMGLNPDIFLMLPRIFALVIIMPLIVFFADMASLAGEMVIVKLHMGVSYTQFLDRIYEYVEIRHIMLGLLKAPLFGLLIGIIGCYRGLQVKSGTDIGKYTTKSVVDSIFWLIIINALISLLSIELGF
jgi:phospholipid/cholesterol/gamma-HCH transport system permease protein